MTNCILSQIFPSPYLPSLPPRPSLSLLLLQDVDECTTLQSSCEQVCQNTVGGYNCTCDAGYTLNSDGLTCNGAYVTSDTV